MCPITRHKNWWVVSTESWGSTVLGIKNNNPETRGKVARKWREKTCIRKRRDQVKIPLVWKFSFLVLIARLSVSINAILSNFRHVWHHGFYLDTVLERIIGWLEFDLPQIGHLYHPLWDLGKTRVGDLGDGEEWVWPIHCNHEHVEAVTAIMKPEKGGVGHEGRWQVVKKGSEEVMRQSKNIVDDEFMIITY